MKAIPRALPVVPLFVLAAIWLGGCESMRAIDRLGMLGTSLLCMVIGTGILALFEWGRAT